MDERAKHVSEFCLYFNEGFLEEPPRRCVAIKTVSFGSESKTEALLVRITPPCSGKQYAVKDEEVNSLLLSALFAGQSFSPVQKWPMNVHIYLPLIASPEMRDQIDVAETKNIALGELREASELEC